MLLTSIHAYSQTLDTVQQLNEALVTGKRVNKEVIPVQTLSGKELEKLSSLSVADAIRYFSGVQVKDYGGIGGFKTVNIRSMGSHHVGVFYDGIELGNAQNGVVDLGKFSLDNMEAVSLYNGQKSAIFQPAKDFGSAGSVYLVSRVPVFEGTKKDNFKATFKTGSFDLINPSALWEHKINDKLSMQLNAEYMNTTGKYKFRTKKQNGYDTTQTRQNGDVYALRAEAGLFGNVAGGELKTKLYFYNSERGYPGASVKEEPGKFKHQDRQWDSNFFVQSSYKKAVSDFYSMLLSGKYAYDYLHYLSDPNLDVSTMYVENRFKQQELYLSMANEFNILPFWTTAVSADFQWNKLDADLFDFVYPTRYTTLVAAATALHFEQFKFQASVLGSFVNEKTEVENSRAGDKSEFTPTIIASYKPLKKINLNFRGFYKRIFRMPTFNDLYYTFIGSVNLKPEYTNQYNIGSTYSYHFKGAILNDIDIQVDAYINQVWDKIIAVPGKGGVNYRWKMENLGYVKIKGIDVAVRNNWSFSKDILFTTRLTYTYQKAQDFTDKEDSWYGGQIAYIPWHNGSFIVNGSYKSWGLNYSFIYTGERYDNSANIPENYVKAWYTNDLSLSKEFIVKKTKVKLTAEVNNVFNQQYEVVIRYPMPGTNVKFVMNVNF